ncbi:AP2-like ethylene-responsive transcription factor At1g16060 isoform X2 [Mangifera indica]|uniref:AP2-like ethylene-responsive transcription factor At1g16060 isoform X2 n=1 Tax=Mangifera indica TaxID=29780 RepID=UPI001CF97714|nr:AP2-like ethylene-responsive transcription factor At1g16060 isoform X2 [Mangifera indica]
MAKLSRQNPKNNANANANTHNNKNNNSNHLTANNGVTKVKRTRRSVPRDSPPQRSSIYRGVTRHRWTGRYEAHLWDKNCWNESQNKKGRQVYLGAYDDEAAAAHAYDLAALKYWGQDTILNFPLSTYQKELKAMEGQSREEYIGSLRRKSSGFSRGVSKYRGVARHHHNGRWEARIGRVFGNKYLYLGTYATQEEAATAYDMAAIEYRGLNAVTNFDLSRYIKWLKPGHHGGNINPNRDIANPNLVLDKSSTSSTLDGSNSSSIHHQDFHVAFFNNNQQSSSVTANETPASLVTQAVRPVTATSALGLLLQSSKFKEMMEMTAATTTSSKADQCTSTSTLMVESESDPLQCSFPEDIQTYFGCQDEMLFGELNSLVSPMFQCDFDA